MQHALHTKYNNMKPALFFCCCMFALNGFAQEHLTRNLRESAVIYDYGAYDHLREIPFTYNVSPPVSLPVANFVGNAGRKKFRITPNPVSSDANVFITTDQKGLADVVVFDMYGREVKHIRATIKPGSNQVLLTLAALAPGQYEVLGLVKDEKLGSLLFIKR
jgi:hypothetical protein